MGRVTETAYQPVPALAPDDARPHPGTIVMKFGGTSVAGPERLQAVARRLVEAREADQRVVGVLSAMGDTTDELLDLARAISDTPHPRELDMLISVGERISCALAAMAIHDLGHEAISLTGSQAGIVTDTVHTKAKIVEVRAKRINESLDRGAIVLVAGFQGVSSESLDVTTLGRGGASSRVRASSMRSATTRCSRCRRAARGSCSYARSSSRGTTTSGSTCARRSPMQTARGSWRRTNGCWRKR
jgi:phosphoheptose isomerase